MKTTTEDFEKYKAEVSYWLRRYELDSYRVIWEHKKDGENNGWCIQRCLDGWNIKIGLSHTINDTVENIASHEALEALFARYVIMSERRFCTQEQLDDERHRIIGILQKVIKREH